LDSALLARLAELGRCHLVIAGIALPNAGSAASHEKLRFEKAAQFRKVGFKFDRWIDVGHWQMTLSVLENQRPL
jgi:phosphinothricin acetyltransferase